MRVVREKLSFDAFSGVGVISLNPTASLGLVAPYHQQARDVNQMLQNDVTRELYNEFKRLENRAVYCLREKDKVLEEATRKSRKMEDSLMQALADVHSMKDKEIEEVTRKSRKMEDSLMQAIADGHSLKDKAIEEANKKNREMEDALRQALADVNYWKAVANQQTALGQDLAKRLYDKRKKEIADNRIAEKRFAEDAESSTGENGDDEDDEDTAWTRMFKRRCL